MRHRTSHRTPKGLTLIEVLFAALVLTIGLVGILTAFSSGYINVVGSGGQSKATAYAQQSLEKLKNKPFNPGPIGDTNVTGIETGYTLEAGYTGVYRIDTVAGATTPPNRLARITVTVTYSAGGGGRAGGQPQQVRLETLRAE
jgi:Tfp pilus assembly protein PilV